MVEACEKGKAGEGAQGAGRHTWPRVHRWGTALLLSHFSGLTWPSSLGGKVPEATGLTGFGWVTVGRALHLQKILPGKVRLLGPPDLSPYFSLLLPGRCLCALQALLSPCLREERNKTRSPCRESSLQFQRMEKHKALCSRVRVDPEELCKQARGIFIRLRKVPRCSSPQGPPWLDWAAGLLPPCKTGRPGTQ